MLIVNFAQSFNRDMALKTGIKKGVCTCAHKVLQLAKRPKQYLFRPVRL